MKTSILIDHEPVADGGFLVRALLRIQSDPPADDARIPLNLSLVIDRSTSMEGPPLAAARDAVCALVRRLRAEDVVSVVAYHHEVVVVAPPAMGADQEDLPNYVAAIRSGGQTNLSGGWLRARDLVGEGHRPDGVNRILLLTDGLANVGITDTESLVGLCRQARLAGITTTTIGFGPQYDEDLLRAMADAGGGGTHYIGSVDQMAPVFERELDGLSSMCAQNVRVAIRPGADADSMQVAHEYPSRGEGRVLTLEIGDVYASSACSSPRSPPVAPRMWPRSPSPPTCSPRGAGWSSTPSPCRSRWCRRPEGGSSPRCAARCCSLLRPGRASRRSRPSVGGTLRREVP
ncbi:MAG: VWA domain-containing protein [Longimicrobiales bacterium]